jgi:hypothetical protein
MKKSSSLVLFPPKARPVMSSRFMRTRTPLRAAESLGASSNGVGRRASSNRGKRPTLLARATAALSFARTGVTTANSSRHFPECRPIRAGCALRYQRARESYPASYEQFNEEFRLDEPVRASTAEGHEPAPAGPERTRTCDKLALQASEMTEQSNRGRRAYRDHSMIESGQTKPCYDR